MSCHYQVTLCLFAFFLFPAQFLSGRSSPIVDSRLIAFRQLLFLLPVLPGCRRSSSRRPRPSSSPYLSRISLLFLSSTHLSLLWARSSPILMLLLSSLYSCRSSVNMSSIFFAMLRATTSSSLHPDPSLSSSTAYKLSDTHIK